MAQADGLNQGTALPSLICAKAGRSARHDHGPPVQPGAEDGRDQAECGGEFGFEFEAARWEGSGGN